MYMTSGYQYLTKLLHHLIVHCKHKYLTFTFLLYIVRSTHIVQIAVCFIVCE